MFNSEEFMRVYTRRHDFQKQQSIAGRTTFYTHAQCRIVAIKERDQVEKPFPIKPVFHRRLPRIHVPLGLENHDKITLKTQQKGHMMHQEYHSGGNKDTRFLHSKLPSGELQITRAIQGKEQLLHEKLWTVGEKMKSIQTNSFDTAAGYEQKRREDNTRQAEWGEVNTKPRISEYQRRELLKNRGLLLDGSFYDDLKQLREKHWGTEERIRNKYDAQQAKWEEQNEASLENSTWTREKKYKDRMHKNTSSSDDKQIMSLKSLQKSRLASENQKSTGGTLYESTLPLISFPNSQQQQTGPELTTTAGDKFQHLPCKICHRTFLSERLEKHVQICTKTNLKQPQVFNIFNQRCKGTQLEEYLKTHPISKSPEDLTEKRRKNIRKGQ